jgi:hypothetical protein
MSATAISAPFFICRPNADSPPVIGPATAILMSWANAVADRANDAPNARPMSFNDFMEGPRGDRYFWRPGSAGPG